jgi:hypothetical protein
MQSAIRGPDTPFFLAVRCDLFRNLHEMRSLMVRFSQLAKKRGGPCEMLADNGGRLLRPTGRSYDSLLMSGCGQTRNNPSGTKAGFTNDWMGIIGEIRVPPPGIGEAAKSRWLRTQHVNRVLPLTLTLKIGLSNRVVSLNQAAESTPGQQFNLKQSQLAMR